MLFVQDGVNECFLEIDAKNKLCKIVAKEAAITINRYMYTIYIDDDNVICNQLDDIIEIDEEYEDKDRVQLLEYLLKDIQNKYYVNLNLLKYLRNVVFE
jgi:hypothetical protein